jgi:polyferredoxin
MTWSHWRRVRQVVQVLALGLYIYLLFAALQRRAAFELADVFFRLDPLAALTAMLADRAWIPRLALALVTLALRLLLGRVWCGWLCPLGTLLDWIHITPHVSRLTYHASRFTPNLRAVKYILLLLVFSFAVLGSTSLLIFDPITILTRTSTTVILPALTYAVTSIEKILYPVGFFQPVIDGIEKALRGPVLPVKQPAFGQNWLIALLFAGIVALNFLADRFWCRYLCPLGALLGLLAKVSFLRPVIGSACKSCGQCTRVCRVNAIEAEPYTIIPSECVMCLECLAVCAQDSIGLRAQWQPDTQRDFDPTRRQVLAALATGAASVVVLRTDAQAQQPHPHLIRPPGAQDEGKFLSRCLRCSQCMKVCPTAGLQPSLVEGGLEGLWAPRLVPRLGYCDYGCNACGQICPSSAIPRLDLPSKRETIVGVAAIDRNRCLPWARGIPCIVCEEMCPTPQKSIRLEKVQAINDQGDAVVVQRPSVWPDSCIGCGICEYRCPLQGDAAIQVYRR